MTQFVSIVMATYNGQGFIRKQIESILAQSYFDFEVIIIDDASTDQTVKIVKEYAIHDGRIKIYTNKNNLGVVKSFERGLGLSNGDLIVLSDQDDIFLENKLKILLDRFSIEQPSDMIVSDAILINQSGDQIADSLWDFQNIRPKPGKNFASIINNNFATGCTMMFKKTLLSTALPFPKNIHMHDWWVAVVASSSNYSGISVINEKLTLYRQHSNNVFGAQQAGRGMTYHIGRLFKSPKHIADNKKVIYSQHINRLESYLSLKCWTINEEKQILITLKLYQGLFSDYSQPLLKRLLKIPFRLKFFINQKNYKELLRVSLTTIFPSI